MSCECNFLLQVGFETLLLGYQTVSNWLEEESLSSLTRFSAHHNERGRSHVEDSESPDLEANLFQCRG